MYLYIKLHSYESLKQNCFKISSACRKELSQKLAKEWTYGIVHIKFNGPTFRNQIDDKMTKTTANEYKK